MGITSPYYGVVLPFSALVNWQYCGTDCDTDFRPKRWKATEQRPHEFLLLKNCVSWIYICSGFFYYCDMLLYKIPSQKIKDMYNYVYSIFILSHCHISWLTFLQWNICDIAFLHLIPYLFICLIPKILIKILCVITYFVMKH